jgi:hypothetical protein
LTCEDFQADVASSEVVDGVDQVVQVSAKPVELPDHERVTVAKRFQALGQAQGSGHRDDCGVVVRRLTCMNTVDTVRFTPLALL